MTDENGDVDLSDNDDDDATPAPPTPMMALFLPATTNGAKCQRVRDADRLAAIKARTAWLAALRYILDLFGFGSEEEIICDLVLYSIPIPISHRSISYLIVYGVVKVGGKKSAIEIDSSIKIL